MSREFYQDGWGRNQSSTDSCNHNALASQASMQDKSTSWPYNYGQKAGKESLSMMSQMKEFQNLYGYDEVGTIPLQSASQTKCCPFDAYGLNTYSRSYTPINVVKDCIEDLYIPLTISVKVPVGFMIPEGRQFGTYLAMDKSALSINTITQHYVYTNMNQCSCSSPEVVKMQVSILNGLLHYNLTLDNFVPAQGLQSAVTSDETYLNSYGTLAVDKVLGYAPFGYTTQDYYVIEVIPQRESITLPDDKCIYKRNEIEEYKRLLANPDIERVLNFSYVVVIRSANMA